MFWTVTQSLLTGLATTFEIFILTLIFALPLGLVLAFGLLSKFKPLQRLVQILVWIIRGTPLMLQLIIIFYGYYNHFFRFLIVSLLFVIVCLTESGSKSRRLLMRIQMRNISKRAHAEGRDPFSPLLCNNGAHR